jgi:RHS repeat-associated protein
MSGGRISNGISAHYFLAYDARGRVSQSRQTTGGQNYDFSYNYNLAGSLTSETYPSSRTITSSYDQVNRITEVSGALGSSTKTYVTGVQYTPSGAPNWYRYGNSICRTFTYNSRLQPSLWTDTGSPSTGNAACENPSDTRLMQSWSWRDGNNNGTLQSSTVWHGGPGYPAFTGFKTTYGYDGVNRLGGATETNIDGTSTYWLRGFQYDQYGNMWTNVNGGVPTWSMTPTSNVFNSANQIAGVSYDGAGNQTAIGPYTLQYDAENRLIQASQPASAGGGQVQYSYDAEGKRITKSFLSGPSTVYVYDVFGSLAAEYSSAPLTTAPVCGTCYLSTDHLGSTRLVTGENGSVIARHDYLPFGEEIPSGYANRGADWAADDSVKQKFTGKERDTETGLDYFGARYYGSALGRFTSADDGSDQEPGDPQSWNLYGYGRNNPLRFTDPDGHDAADSNDPCRGNPNCVTVTDKAPGLSTLDALLYRSLSNVMQQSMQVQQIGQQVFNWLSQPRNGTCLSASTAAGASAGAGVGMLGLAGGPAVGITEPTAMAIGGGIGWAGGMVSCMSSSGGTGGGGTGSGSSSSSRKWKWGSHKSSQKVANQMTGRGWTDAQIDEAVDRGAQYSAPNNINPANGATRYVHPTTGRSVVIDNVTKEVLHVGGDGFKY